MAILLLQDDELRAIKFQEIAKVILPDGMTVWSFGSTDGVPVLTRMGIEVDLGVILNASPPGLVLEFGVAGGASIRKLALSGRKIYGFDWWKGIPHDWNEADPKGLCLAAKPTDLPDNVTLVEGLFSDTLEGFLENNDGPVGFVHIDCDLFCSCLYVLHCLVDRFVRGSVIAFDEMDQGHYGELEAWDRYLRETGQHWEFIGKQHAWGQVYRCVDSKPR